MNNTEYLLALNRLPGIGPRTIMRLRERWPNLADLFRLSSQALIEAGLPAKLAEALTSCDRKAVEADLAWQQEKGHHILTWEDSRYPALLKEIHNPPPVLYAKGNLDCLLAKPVIAIVGSRRPSESGKETAWRFSRELALNGFTVVSGLALGIDAKAHEGCLAVKGKTIAVMGTGIDSIYPRQHGQLARKIQEDGLLITEFPLKTAANAGHFPRRNRIISGLSLSTLVVEAAINSGSLITARLALEQNRDVFAIPGSIHNPQARGCHHLLQQGAKLVTSIQDILEETDMVNASTFTDKNCISLAEDDKNLVKFVGFETTTIDQIIQRSGLSLKQVTCDLAQLELQGIVKAVGGGYARCIPGAL